jgi:cytochrome c peroxidase
MRPLAAALALAAALLLAACRPAPPAPGAGAAFGLPPLAAAADPRPDPERIELGRKLFFDRRLSFNGTMSCAMCHLPEEGFGSRASRTAIGIEGKSLRRNAPTLLNVAWQHSLFHDGRETSLATQAWAPLLHPDEMANPSIGNVLDRIRGLADYAGRFERAFGGAGASMDTVGAAIAAFEATLVAADSRFDRWRYGGQADALDEIERLGFELFTGKAGCAGCHRVGERDALFADGLFHATGVAAAAPAATAFVVPLARGVQTTLSPGDLASLATDSTPDLGRFEVTLDPDDRHAFKTPSLRNVAQTAPYMHDGSLATLEDVVAFYDRGGGELPAASGRRSARLRPLDLTPREKQALVAFLRALDGSALAALAAGTRPPDGP